MDQARLEKLKEDAQALLTKFGILYSKNYGGVLFDFVQEELQQKNTVQKKLTSRDWGAVPREDLFKANLLVQSGSGPGDFSDAKTRYVVERQDYGIDLFDDEKAFTAGKKPAATIQPAGYALTTTVRDHYEQQIGKLAGYFGMSEKESTAYSNGFSDASWALTHPQRTNYIFQLSKGGSESGGGGCCSKGNSVNPGGLDEMSEEDKKAHEAARTFMEVCLANARPRDLKVAIGLSFERTCKELPSVEENLRSDWSDDGTEPEILVDVLVEVLLDPKEFIQNLKGPMVMRVKLWFKIQKQIIAALAAVVTPAWNTMQAGIKAVTEKIEPPIRSGLAEIIKVKMTVEDKVKALIVDKISQQLASKITPTLGPFIGAFELPLKESFKAGRDLLSEKINPENLPNEVKARNTVLDKIPRDSTNYKALTEPLGALTESIDKLKESSDIYDAVDVDSVLHQTERALMETVDAAIFTLEQRLEKAESQEFELQKTILETVLQEYDFDVLIVRATFVKKVTTSIVAAAFRKIISPIVDPVIESLNSSIPEPMKAFLNLDKIVNDLIRTFVGQPIEKMVEKTHPMPK